MELKTSLGRAKGLGSAKSGFEHWWWQRLTAIVLVPLTLYLVVVLLKLPDISYDSALLWLSIPLNAAIFSLFLLAGLFHSVLGLQVVIEDYIGCHWLRLGMIVGTKILFTFLGLLSFFYLIAL